MGASHCFEASSQTLRIENICSWKSRPVNLTVSGFDCSRPANLMYFHWKHQLDCIKTQDLSTDCDHPSVSSKLIRNGSRIPWHLSWEHGSLQRGRNQSFSLAKRNIIKLHNFCNVIFFTSIRAILIGKEKDECIAILCRADVLMYHGMQETDWRQAQTHMETDVLHKWAAIRTDVCTDTRRRERVGNDGQHLFWQACFRNVSNRYMG